jgi:hypothetical protein
MQKSTKIENCSMEADAAKLESVRRLVLDTLGEWRGDQQ